MDNFVELRDDARRLLYKRNRVISNADFGDTVGTAKPNTLLTCCFIFEMLSKSVYWWSSRSIVSLISLAVPLVVSSSAAVRAGPPNPNIYKGPRGGSSDRAYGT